MSIWGSTHLYLLWLKSKSLLHWEEFLCFYYHMLKGCYTCCCCFSSHFDLFFISPQGEPLARGTRLKGIKETRRLVGWLCARLKIWCLRAMKLNLMQNYVHGLPTPIGLMSVPITARLTVVCFLLLSMLDFFIKLDIILTGFYCLFCYTCRYCFSSHFDLFFISPQGEPMPVEQINIVRYKLKG